MKRSHTPAILVAACAALQPVAAHAHHAMGNALPGNVFEGLLSGLAHPLIGLDHFVFVLAMGAACYYFGQRVLGIGAFLIAALAGTMLHVQQTTLPYAELWIAASLVTLGLAVLLAAPARGRILGPIFFALAGVVHGYAYGESIVGAEQTPLVAYLVGFTVIQCAIALAGFALARQADRMHRSTLALKTVGGIASVAGVAFLLMAL
ncbi:MAG: HupE/UreJ family protein [Burkholderiales bacterium]